MFALSWTLGVGVDSQGGNKKTDDWTEVLTRLQAVCVTGGTVTLETLGDAPWRNLQLQAEEGNLLLTLTDDEGELRMLDNPEGGPDDVEILGDVYDPSTVTRDTDLVERAFKELFDTGDVSTDLLA